jgi:hypothetical protein
MTTRTHGPPSGSHDVHDRLLVAARAAGDLAGRDLDRAELLLAGCERCHGLLGELRAIAAATRSLPPAQRPATLDFRLSPERARRLARGRGWRRLLRPFGRTGIGTIRPLAATFTTLGVAGLLLAALPMLPFTGAATFQTGPGGSSETREANHESFALATAPSGDLSFDPLVLKAQAPSVGGTLNVAASDEAALGAPTGGIEPGDGSKGSGDPAPLVILSTGFLGTGLGLFLLRRAAIRLR